MDNSPIPFAPILSGDHSRAKGAARLLGFVFLSLVLDGLAAIGSLGATLLTPNKRGGAMILEDSYSRAIEIFGYFFFVLTFLFAINFGNDAVALASVGVIVMQLVGERLNAFAGPGARRPARPKLGSTLTYVVLDLGLFAALDIVGSTPWSLPGLSNLSVLNSNFSQAVSLGSLFSIQIAIAEEEFFRGGAANLGSKYGGPLLGIFTSASFFAIYHIPVYYTNPTTLLIIFADGAVLAWSDFDVGRILPSMIAHLTNNIIFALIASVVGTTAFGAVATHVLPLIH